MFGYNQARCLTAFAVLATLGAQPLGGSAQTQTKPTPETPAISTQPPPTAIFAAVEPTAEQVGDAMMAHQRYQAAIEAYKKVRDPSAEVFNQMGIAYQMMFNLTDATRCYEQSLRLQPHNTDVMNNLGTVYDSLKEFGPAERMYRKALKLQPKSALIEKNLGTNLLAQHHYKKGWEAYQAALAIDPEIFQGSVSLRVDNPASVQDRGAMNYYMAKGCVRAHQNDRAIEYLRMALNEGFTNPKKIEADSEFAGLHGLPAFDQLLAAQGTP
jgi:tetratricopeptide (TPR) repeat protein